MKTYYVYILTNKYRGTLYMGVTSDLQRRMIEHKLGKFDGFTKKYHLKKLVYVESYQYIYDAIDREKRLKRWPNEWKVQLVEENNPKWNDLYGAFFGPFLASDWLTNDDAS